MTKIIVSRVQDTDHQGEHLLQVLGQAETEKELRDRLRDLPPGEYSVFSLYREKVVVGSRPTRVTVDLGPPAQTRGTRGKAKPVHRTRKRKRVSVQQLEEQLELPTPPPA